jgi:DNA-binding beta-propeller fold protein YncE
VGSRRWGLAVLGCVASLMALVTPGQTSRAGGITKRAGICGSPHQQTLFADTSAKTDGFLYAFKVPSGKVAWRTRLPGSPVYGDSLSVLACRPTGYVVVVGSRSTGLARLIPFATSTGTLGHPINVGLPGQVAISPSGRTAYVANSGELAGMYGPVGRTITPVDLVSGSGSTLGQGRLGQPLAGRSNTSGISRSVLR